MLESELAGAPQEETAQGTPEPAADGVKLSDAAAQLEALTVERDQLAELSQELNERLMRRQADFENFRRRVEKDRADFATYAGMETVRALLPMLDDFERAMQAAPQVDGAAAEFVKGIGMIHQRLLDTLKKAGLEPIEAEGKPFDPNVHHAVESVETEEADDQTVLEEWQKGYNFKGRLLREAMVRVAVRPAESKPGTDSE